MLEELFREGAEPHGEEEKMVIICKLEPRCTEKGPPGDKLKEEAAKTPDVKGFVDGSGKNQLGRSKAEGSKDLCRRVRKEICCSGR